MLLDFDAPRASTAGLSAPEGVLAFSRLDEVHVGDSIAVTDNHHPPVEEEIVAEVTEIDQGWGKTQFLQSAHHCSR
jgi:hypothetical protein